MYNAKKYFSLVTDRITMLQEELKSVQTQRLHSTEIDTIRKCQLKEDFISAKINYLKKLEDLPLVILFSNLSDEQTKELQQEGKIPTGEDGSYLIKSLGLEKLSKFIQQPKIVTMSHIKDSFINDFDGMDEFLSMNQRNIEMMKKRDELQGTRLDGSLSYLKISHDERNLKNDNEKLEALISQSNEDFDLETLKEIAAISRNPNQKLPLDFILKHSQRVLAGNPLMEKTIKRLSRRKWFTWANKWLPKKANKDDIQFIEALNTYYNNHSIASELNVSSANLFDKDDVELEEFVEQIQTKCRIRKNQLSARKNQINISKKFVLKQIRNLFDEQAKLKEQFVALIRTKTSFLPKSFQDQIWNERDLKESCIREACYLEEKNLVTELTNLLQDKTLATVEENKLETIESPKSKQLVA